MKKFLVVLAGVALVATGATAASVAWVGSSVAYVNGQWFNCSGTWGAGGSFNGHDFGLVSELILGGNVSTWWNDSGTHTGTTVLLGFNVDGTGDHTLALPWLDYSPNNDRWEQMAGVNLLPYVGTGTDHHVAIWFQASDGSTTVYDSNFSANYTASFTTAVPEPTTTALWGLGALLIALRRRRNS